MSRPAGSFGVALSLVTLIGFVTLSYEILWIRVFGFVTEGVAPNFGVLLGAYLLGVAGGAAVARRWCRSEAEPAAVLRALTLLVFVASLFGFLLIPLTGEIVQVGPYGWGYVLIALASMLFGVNLPLIAHFGIPADQRVGSRLSYLYLGNILGSTLGSLVTGFVLMDLWPMAKIALFLGYVSLAVTALMVWLSGFTGRLRLGLVVALVAVTALTAVSGDRLFDRIWEKLQLKSEFTADTRFPTIIETKSGVITVTADGRVCGGGAYDGRFNVGLMSDGNWIVRPYALAAFDRTPKDVLMVGLGSGSWAQVVAHLPGLERLTVIEINEGYLELVKSSPVVSSLLDNPKVTLVIDDGRRWLNHHDDSRFDFIVQNTTHHWRGHITNLVSTEYLEIVKRHLKPGGLFLTNATQSDDVQRTTVESFGHAWRFMTCIIASDRPLSWDADLWRQRLSTWKNDGRPLFDLTRADHRERLREVTEDGDWENAASIRRRTAGATIITDDNMASEW